MYRKAERLRELTGDIRITSEKHIENSKLTAKYTVCDILWHPLEIIVFEPVVLLINIYIGLVYSIIYLWFKAFPIVFYDMHHFTLIELGLTHLATIIGILVGATVYIFVIYNKFTKKVLGGESFESGGFLPIVIVGAILMPIGITLFSWTSTPDIHWIVPLFGGAIFASGFFIVFQTLFNYLSTSF